MRHEVFYSRKLLNGIRNTDVLYACKDIGLAVNIVKNKYMEIGRHWCMMANEHIMIGSNSCKKVKNFKYLGSLLTNPSSLGQKIKYKQEIHVGYNQFVFSTSL